MSISASAVRAGEGIPAAETTPVRAKAAWLWRIFLPAVCGLTVVLFLAGVPVFYDIVKRDCIDTACEAFYNPPPGSAWLREHGMSPAVYSFSYTMIYVLFGAVHLAAAIVLFLKRSQELMGRLGILMLMTFSITFTPILSGLPAIHPVFAFMVHLTETIGLVTFILFFALFPNGRFEPRWSMWLSAAMVAVRAPGMLFPESPLDLNQYPKPFLFAWLLLWTGGLAAIQVYRYRTTMGPLERQQAKWVVFGLFIGVGGLLGQTVFYILFERTILGSPLYTYLLEIGIHGVMALIPLTLLTALLRHRLWEIDPILNRTIVYGFLTLCIISVYAAAVWYISAVLQTGRSVIASFGATAVVAVLFAPLKERLQRMVNRMMYGEKDDPSAVLSRLGERLKEPLPPEEVLVLVVRTIRDAMRLPYACLSLRQGGELCQVAETGMPQEGLRRIPLVHRGEELGDVKVAPRTPGEPFHSSDMKFLELLVRQSGAVVQGVKASMDLKLLAAELQESRERLVLAREEERRSIRSNLHDDLAPRLAALALTASAAETLVDTNPAGTKSILAEFRSTIRSTVDEIRRLVYDLRPPALDELGLIGAVQERMDDLTAALLRVRETDGTELLRFELKAPAALPALPAAVEVAAYRILTEAMVNAVKHARASVCRVEIAFCEGKKEQADEAGAGAALVLRVSDDGIGLLASAVPPAERTRSRGLGLHSMKERAAELGGACTVEGKDEGGTRVLARLPLELEPHAGGFPASGLTRNEPEGPDLNGRLKGGVSR